MPGIFAVAFSNSNINRVLFFCFNFFVEPFPMETQPVTGVCARSKTPPTLCLNRKLVPYPMSGRHRMMKGYIPTEFLNLDTFSVVCLGRYWKIHQIFTAFVFCFLNQSISRPCILKVDIVRLVWNDVASVLELWFLSKLIMEMVVGVGFSQVAVELGK